MTPEHLHLLLVHLPIFGLALALGPLAWAAWRRDRTVALVGLALAAVTALSTPLVAELGEAAEERLEHAAPPAALDPAGERWLHEHEERAERATPAVVVAALALGAGLVALARRPDAAWVRAVSLGAAGTACLSLALLAWVADAGGKVRHAELRAGELAAAAAGATPGDRPAAPAGDHDDDD